MKKYRRVMSHDTEEWCKVWRKTDSWFQKWQGVWWSLMREVASLEICTLMCYICQWNAKFQLKMCSIVSDDTEKWSILWRKTDFLFEKWNEEFGGF